ncbi:MAG: hypothetical protein Q4C54_04200 [Clostridia bacterium]|nr:hypothetical protein [Clostridia bacterium]
MLKQAMSRAWGLYRRHFGGLLLMLVVQLMVVLMSLAPLLFLLNPATRLLALLCPVLFVLLVLPMRQNAAMIMRDLQKYDTVYVRGLISVKDYGCKLRCGLMGIVCMLPWMLLFIASTGLLYYVYSANPEQGGMDVFAVMRLVRQIGGGSTVTGVKYVVLMYLATLLPVLAGFAFHSGTRHAYALGDRKIIKGHRGGVVAVWLLGLVTVVPFIAVAGAAGFTYVQELMKALSNIMGGLSLPKPDGKLYIIVAAFVLLLLPLVPLKQLMTSCYVNLIAEGEHKA